MRIAANAIAALALLLAPHAKASLALAISSGNFLDQNGAPVAAGTLFQLVNLGPDGVFSPIDFSTNETGLDRWVSGDDSVINATLIGDDFPTTAAFDLMQGEDLSPGFLYRVLQLDTGIPAVGTKFGIRWFPGIQASNFQNATLHLCQPYGQFTRQTEPTGSDAWVIKQMNGTNSLEPLFTTGLGGPDSEGPGSEARAVQWCPEPGSAALILIGTAGLAVLRRLRA